MMKQLQQHKFYQLASSENGFEHWVLCPVYKTYTLSNGFFKNTHTGENCGQTIYLHKYWYKDGQKLKEPIYDEDCYEAVFYEV